MKLFILITLGFFCLTSFAEVAVVTQGELISASKMNEVIQKINEMNQKIVLLEQKVLPVGSIVHSLLTIPQFQSKNGDCWKLMDGSNIVGTDLSTINGMTSLPNSVTEGTFLRQAKSGRVIGTFEGDDNKSHDHGVYTAQNTSQSYGLASQSGYNQIGNINYTGGQDTISRTDFQGSSESRPKNTAVNLFVKTKEACNFN